jgi:spore protease
MHTKEAQTYSLRTDLALELREQAMKDGEIDGVEVEHLGDATLMVTRLYVTSPQGMHKMGMQEGQYVTIEVPSLRQTDHAMHKKVEEAFAHELREMFVRRQLAPSASVLVVGLGNRQVTPDALGPLTIEQVTVTRHWQTFAPAWLAQGYRVVSAFAPGVLGITGMETSEVVSGIVRHLKPDVVIAIDALASRALQRVYTTIQLTDTGIHPGAGIGNKRQGITEQTLGVPVFAIGVPTVVYASTIAHDTLELLARTLQAHTKKTKEVLGVLSPLTADERLQLVQEVLEPLGHNLVVTPKEVDAFVENMAHTIACGLNKALHDPREHTK